jgi:GDP-4-dehydro-6-deoxy-D-mannose reductase
LTLRRILLTGAGGFVGHHLIPLLRDAYPSAQLFFDQVEVTDAGAIAASVADASPDACIHLAAVSGVPAARRDPDLAWRVNLFGTLNLARSILAHAPACPLLFISSADIYGASFRAGVALDETATPAPMNTYSATKAAADLALGALAGEGLRAIRVRPFNHTGPRQSNSFVVAAFAEQIARIEIGQQPPVMKVGDLTPLRDFLDVRDVCAAYVACLREADRIAPGAILNIASGSPRTVRQVLDDLLAEARIDVTVETDPARLRPSEIPTAAGNADLARRLLGWEPSIPWTQTIRETLEDWRARVR